jgi:hypothetical protein
MALAYERLFENSADASGPYRHLSFQAWLPMARMLVQGEYDIPCPSDMAVESLGKRLRLTTNQSTKSMWEKTGDVERGRCGDLTRCRTDVMIEMVDRTITVDLTRKVEKTIRLTHHTSSKSLSTVLTVS